MTDLKYSTRHMANILNVSRETIRAWSHEFADFLHEDARPEDGKRRYYNSEDVRVLALVAQLKQRHQPYAEIHVALANGDRADPPDGATALTSDTDQKRIFALQTRVAQLEQQLDDAQAEVARADLLKEQLTEAQAEIARLNREIGALEDRMKRK